MSDHDMDGDLNESGVPDNEEEIQKRLEQEGLQEESAGSLPWSGDAGFSDEFQHAEVETKRAVIAMANKKLEGDAAIEQVREQEKDIVKRAHALAKLGACTFPDEMPIKSGDMIIMQPKPTDGNRWAGFDAIFGSGPDRPHINEFSGRLTDHIGRIIDDRYHMVHLVKALAALGLKGQSADQTRKAFKEWAMMVRTNDLILRMENMIPEWDGAERAEGRLIELFECHDTPLNRQFGKYFWLSLYCRLMHPGENAPMVLALFGAQDAGKSYFSKLLARVILGDPDADSVQLNLAADTTSFLREITGMSVVASVGEMTGFTRGDLNKIKDFITRTADNMHQKFEGNYVQPRQWITVMDGNKYEGLQRDDSGNRRFYPMFVAQLEDKGGQPNWKKEGEFTADFTDFAEKFWMVMAECRDWMKEHGIKGYLKHVSNTSKAVAEFNRAEMARDRGTIRDDELDTFLLPALRKCRKQFWLGRGVAGADGVAVFTEDFAMCYNSMARFGRLNYRHVKTKMEALGGEARSFSGGARGYLFTAYKDIEDFNSHVGERFREELLEGSFGDAEGGHSSQEGAGGF